MTVILLRDFPGAAWSCHGSSEPYDGVVPSACSSPLQAAQLCSPSHSGVSGSTAKFVAVMLAVKDSLELPVVGADTAQHFWATCSLTWLSSWGTSLSIYPVWTPLVTVYAHSNHITPYYSNKPLPVASHKLCTEFVRAQDLGCHVCSLNFSWPSCRLLLLGLAVTALFPIDCEPVPHLFCFCLAFCSTTMVLWL